MRHAVVLAFSTFLLSSAPAVADRESSTLVPFNRWLEVTVTESQGGEARPAALLSLPLSADGGQSRVEARVAGHSYLVEGRIDPRPAPLIVVEITVTRSTVSGTDLNIRARLGLIPGRAVILVKRHQGEFLVTHVAALVR